MLISVTDLLSAIQMIYLNVTWIQISALHLWPTSNRYLMKNLMCTISAEIQGNQTRYSEKHLDSFGCVSQKVEGKAADDELANVKAEA